MPDLTFLIEGATPVAFAVSPQIALAVRVVNAQPEEAVHSALLRCQIQIDATARRYDARESDSMSDLFGDASTFGRAVKRLMWAQATAVVPPFTHEGAFEVHVPCTFDMCISTAKYFRALVEGGAPVVVLFTGTVFHRDAVGALRASPVPWSAEARFTIPAHVWHDALDDHYAGIAPVPVRRDLFERLDRYRRENGLPSWDAVIDRLLPGQVGQGSQADRGKGVS
jgi:hypothetical protein